MYSPPAHVAILNKSSSLDDGEAALWVEVYREEIKRVADAWQLPPPGMALYPRGHTEEPDPAVAGLYIVDSAGDPDALGYHTAAGRARWGYVDMTLSAAYDIPSVVFGHELYELFVDADVDRWVGPLRDGSHVAIEVCDPVQRTYYTVQATLFGRTADVKVSDFVLPAWFSPGSPGPYSHTGHNVSQPLEDAVGGYHVTERDGVVMTGAARVRSFGRTFRRLARGRR
jgi:hypothetical protein